MPLEAADRGTVLLTEVGGMSLNVQARLLRFIETGEIDGPSAANWPLPPISTFVSSPRRGAPSSTGLPRTVSTRSCSIASTRCTSPFRHCASVARTWCRSSASACVNSLDVWAPLPPELTDEAWERLTEYSWPRNLRELREVAERLLQRCRGGRVGVDGFAREIAHHGGSPRGPYGSRLSPIQRPLLEGSIRRLRVDPMRLTWPASRSRLGARLAQSARPPSLRIRAGSLGD